MMLVAQALWWWLLLSPRRALAARAPTRQRRAPGRTRRQIEARRADADARARQAQSLQAEIDPCAGQRPRWPAGGPGPTPRRADPGRRQRGGDRSGPEAHPRRRQGAAQGGVVGDPRSGASSDDGRVLSKDLQVVTNALWEAGAEAISINGQRLTARSAIRFAGDAILVNYRPLTRPYVISAIGDPQNLQVEFADNRGVLRACPRGQLRRSCHDGRGQEAHPSRRTGPHGAQRDEGQRATHRNTQHHSTPSTPQTRPRPRRASTVIPVLGLIGGILIGSFLQPEVPLWLQPYLPIAVIAALDAVFGAVRAVLDGISSTTRSSSSPSWPTWWWPASSSSSATSSASAPSCPPAWWSFWGSASSPTSPRSGGTSSAHEPAASPRDTPAAEPPAERSAWRMMFRMARPRATRANFFAAALALALGFALPRRSSRPSSRGWSSSARTSWSASSTTSRRTRPARQRRPRPGGHPRPPAQRGRQQRGGAARGPERLDTLGILAGTVPAEGPGIVLTIDDPDKKVTSALLLDAFRSCGTPGPRPSRSATSVSSRARTSPTCRTASRSAGPGERPYEIRAIGESATMASAMDIPGV